MRRSQDEFWHCRFSQVVCMISMYVDKQMLEAATAKNEHYESKYFKQQEEARDIKSMKEIEGW